MFLFSTTGDIKKLLVHKTGLEPEEQRLFFRGIEKDDKEKLHLEGLKDKSKILLLEGAASKERKLEETRKLSEISKASEAIAGVRAEVDKLLDRVSMFSKYNYSSHSRNILTGERSYIKLNIVLCQVNALEVAINAGNKASEKEFLVLTELLMGQLLKLDGIEAEGEAKLQRKVEVVFMTLK